MSKKKFISSVAVDKGWLPVKFEIEGRISLQPLSEILKKKK